MTQAILRKIIGKVERWTGLTKSQKKEIVSSVYQDEVSIGTSKTQEAYRKAIKEQNFKKLYSLRVQQEKRRQDAIKWLKKNGY